MNIRYLQGIQGNPKISQFQMITVIYLILL